MFAGRIVGCQQVRSVTIWPRHSVSVALLGTVIARKPVKSSVETDQDRPRHPICLAPTDHTQAAIYVHHRHLTVLTERDKKVA